MAAVFVLCARNGPGGLEVLLGEKLDDRKQDQGLTVPTGHIRGKQERKSRVFAATRELREETGIALSHERFLGFRIKGGDYWFWSMLTCEEPRPEPEFDRFGRAVWGPARFYPIQELPKLPIARWHRKKLLRAVGHLLEEASVGEIAQIEPPKT
ncbi:MAG: NUDIX hydrolase [Parcubacteria group bacterium]|nr:NUDIX hydrolase [Parcubacteria group bacterium]